MKKFKVSIEMTVAQSWIEDGFDLTEHEDDIKEAFAAMLPYAYDHEVKVEITSLTSHQYKIKGLTILLKSWKNYLKSWRTLIMRH